MSNDQSRIDEFRETEASNSTMETKEYVFVYRYDEVFSFKEMQDDLSDNRALSKLFQTEVWKRLKIKEVPDLLGLNQNLGKGFSPNSTNSFFTAQHQLLNARNSGTRFIAYF